jgi:hypothetical protein
MDQHRKLVAHPTFAPVVVMVTTTGADQKRYEMVCMPADLIMGWLMTIHPDRVAPKKPASEQPRLFDA